MPAQLLIVATLLVAGNAAYRCTDDDGCEQLGECTAGVCVCNSGFTGPSCGSVDLAPAPGATSGGMVWPRLDVNAAHNASAWGFTSVFDPEDGLYHAFVTVACGGADVVGQGGGNSYIAHLSSHDPDGGFSLVAAVTPATTFGPHLAIAADGTFVLVFRVNILNATAAACGGGNGSAPLPGLLNASYIPASSLQSGDPEVGTSIWIAWAKTMSGPWSVVKTNITGAGSVHKSNPSVAPLLQPVLIPGGGGTVATWIMAYRYNEGGERNAIALAADFRGPWACVANVTPTPGCKDSEDPFVWQQPGAPATAHMLYHCSGFGYHAWGPVAGGGSGAWRLSPTGAHAFNLTVATDGGSGSVALSRRERPELRWVPAAASSRGAAGAGPAFLFNGVVGPDGTAYSMAQPVAPSR